MTNLKRMRKVVFPVAGFGTRFLPATTAMPKELLPIVDKPDVNEAPLNLASIGRYVLTPDIFDTLRGLSAVAGGEIQLSDAINIHVQKGTVETVRLKGWRFDFGSVDGFMKASSFEYKTRVTN